MGLNPGLQLPYGIQPTIAAPVDAYYGPYTSLSQAKTSIPQSVRYDGMTVQITGVGEYHWLQADLSDAGLIVKTSGSSFTLTNGNGTTANGTAVDLGGTLSANVDIEGNHDFVMGANTTPLSLFDIVAGNAAYTIFAELKMSQVAGASIQFTDASNNYSVVAVEPGKARMYASSDGGLTHHTEFSLGGDTAGSWLAKDLRTGANQAGIQYFADYSTHFTARSLVDKNYVDTAVSGGSVTASNGLTKTGGNITLGGTLIQATNIDGHFNLNIGSTTPLANVGIYFAHTGATYKELRIASSQVPDTGIYILDDATGAYSRIGGSSIGANGFANLTFDVDGVGGPSSIKLDDSRPTPKGIEYNADYSANFTARSLVDKAYVDAAVAGGGAFWPLNGAANTTGYVSVTSEGHNIQIFAGDVGLTVLANLSLYQDGTFGLSTTLATASANITTDSLSNLILATIGAATTISSNTIITLNADDGAGGGEIDILATNQLVFQTQGEMVWGVADGTQVTFSNNQGLLYSADYSANFVDRSLVDKGYVDSLIAVAAGWPLGGTGTLTANSTIQNGATYYDISLGGAGTMDTDHVSFTPNFNNVIGHYKVNSHNVEINNVGTGVVNNPGIFIRNWDSQGSNTLVGEIALRSTNGGVSGVVEIHSASDGQVSISDYYGAFNSDIPRMNFTLSHGGAIYTDYRGQTSTPYGLIPGSPAGIEYAADYSATYSSRSLVDKNYVDTHSLIGSTSTINTETWLGFDAGGGGGSSNYAVFVGVSAGHAASAADFSVMLGNGAGYGAINAINSEFVGVSAGANAVNASFALFLGDNAGGNATNAQKSIFIGSSAGLNDTVDNTVSGSSILIGISSSTGGNQNSIAIGANATNTLTNQFLVEATYNNWQIAGVDYVMPAAQASAAGYVLTNDGAGNLSWAAGGGGLIGNTDPLWANAWLGLEAGLGGDNNATVFIGYQAGKNTVTSTSLVAIGQQAGLGAQNAVSGVFIGESSGTGIHVSGVTAIGANSGAGATNASGGIFVGGGAGLNAHNASSVIFIGNGAGANDTVDNVSSSGSSILIGNSTSTGGWSNSIAIGDGMSSSVINTMSNQFLVGSQYVNWQIAGVDYVMPLAQAAGADYVLTNDGAGNLSWAAGGGGGGAFWPLAGTATLTGDVTIDGNANVVTIGNFSNPTSGFNVFSNGASANIILTNETSNGGIYLHSINDDSGVLTSEIFATSGVSNFGKVGMRTTGFGTHDGSVALELYQFTLDGSGGGSLLMSFDIALGGTTFTDLRGVTNIYPTSSPGVSKGIEYAADYSAGYSPRSLVDKAYVDAAVGGGGSAWPLTGSASFTGDVNIDGYFNVYLGSTTALAGYSVYASSADLTRSSIVQMFENSVFINTANSGDNTQSGIFTQSNSINITSASTSTGSGSEILMNPTSVVISYASGITTYATSNSISDGVITITSTNPAFAGEQYAADYSTNFTARSLVDKAYVDAVAIGGGNIVSGSGISVVAGFANLGGSPLTQDANINGAFAVAFGTVTKLNSFTVDADSFIINTGVGTTSTSFQNPGNGYSFQVLNSTTPGSSSNFGMSDTNAQLSVVDTTNAQSSFNMTAGQIELKVQDATTLVSTDVQIYNGGLIWTTVDNNHGGRGFSIIANSSASPSYTTVVQGSDGSVGEIIMNPAVMQSVFSNGVTGESGTFNLGNQINLNYFDGVQSHSQFTGSAGDVGLAWYNNTNSQSLDLSSMTGAVFTDNSAVGGGLMYGADYSSTYTARSLVDKNYVDNAIVGGGVTGGNAITVGLGNSVNLGGTFNQDTDINGNGHSLSFGTNVSAFTKLSSFNVMASVANYVTQLGINQVVPAFNVFASLPAGTYQTGVKQQIQVHSADGYTSSFDQSAEGWSLYGDKTGAGTLSMFTNDAGATYDITSSSNTFVVTSLNSAGITYAADYSTGFVARSLVDKAYVDNVVIGGGLFVFSNGLTNTTGSVTLGGGLIQDTNIDGGYNFLIGSITPLAQFYVATLAGASTSNFISDGNSTTIVNSNPANGNAQIEVDVFSINLSVSNTSTPTVSFSMAINSIIVGDGGSGGGFPGIAYDQDYSANFSTYSLVDKNYVDTHSLLGQTSFTNNETWIGQNAGNAASTTSTVMIGWIAGQNATSADQATFVGGETGFGATNAVASTFIGFNAGATSTDAHNSIFIGNNAGAGANNAANSIFIGDLAGDGDSVDNTASGASILIGNNTLTNGWQNSIALGTNAGNTLADQFLIGSTYVNWQIAGIDYVMPLVQAVNPGDVLTNDGFGTLSWLPPTSITRIGGDITGDGVTANFVINHNKGTKDVVAQVYDAITDETVSVDIVRVDTNNVSVNFASAPSITESYRVVIL